MFPLHHQDRIKKKPKRKEFFQQVIVTTGGSGKRGPLARIWLAAHWDKKLTKAHVFETNLEDSVETIISPQVKMALRTSGHLLLGVVRIYNRKAKYLLADCNEAFVKIKMAFRPGVVDLPEENREAQHNQIYLTEEFHNFDTPLPDLSDFDITRQLTLNQSRIDEITMPEEVPTTVRLDEGFGGGMMEFGKDVEDRYSAGDLQNMFYKDDAEDAKSAAKAFGFGMDSSGMKETFVADEGDEGILGEGFMQGPGLFGEQQHGGLFGERSPKKPEEEEQTLETTEGAVDHQVTSPSVQQPLQIDEETNRDKPEEQQGTGANPEQVMMEVDEVRPPVVPEETEVVPPKAQPEVEKIKDVVEEAAKDQTVLVENEAEAFALEPLDITGVRDMRMRRKRKLIVDHVMELDGQTMREQLKDFNDIVTTLDMAPPTKRLMQWKEMGGVEKLFSLPSKTAGEDLNKLFNVNLHNEVPHDLLDMTGTQLHEQYGEVSLQSEDSTIQEARHTDDDSRIHDMRVDTTMSTVDQTDSVLLHQTDSLLMQPTDSVLLQGKDPSMNAPVNYQSDDDYEPASVGPPSVASSIGHTGDHPVMGNDNPILSNFEPEMGGLVDPTFQQSPGEGEAFADDFDDLRWNKRTQHLLHSLHRSFKHEREISFFQMTDGIQRKQAVSKFYSLLVLAKQEATILQQSQVFGDVFIKKGAKFDSILM